MDPIAFPFSRHSLYELLHTVNISGKFSLWGNIKYVHLVSPCRVCHVGIHKYVANGAGGDMSKGKAVYATNLNYCHIHIPQNGLNFCKNSTRDYIYTLWIPTTVIRYIFFSGKYAL
jgi:hypothetical protein